MTSISSQSQRQESGENASSSGLIQSSQLSPPRGSTKNSTSAVIPSVASSASSASSTTFNPPPPPPPIPAPVQRRPKPNHAQPTPAAADAAILKASPSHLPSIQPLSIWETLLAYAETSESPLPASTITTSSSSSSSSSTLNTETLDASVVRYGAKVMLRSDSGAGFLSSVRPTTDHIGSTNNKSSNAPPSIALCGNGVAAIDELFVIVHASHSAGIGSNWAGKAEGLPVRTGDVICLRSLATGRFLGTSHPTSGSVSFPKSATTESLQLALSIQGANGNLGGATIDHCWTIASPDSVLAAQSALSRGYTDRLPRPYITGGQRFILISHSPSQSSASSNSSTTSSTSTSLSVVSSAKSAATRLLCATCGTMSSSIEKGKMAYVDSASSSMGASVLTDDDLGVSSSSSSTSSSSTVVRRSPLSQVGAAASLVLSPPIDLLWSLHPILPGETPADGVASAIPLHWPSDDVTCAPFLTGTYCLPRELLPRSQAALSSSIKAQHQRESLSNVPSRSPPSEKEVILAILDALQGMPSTWFTLNLDSLKKSPKEASSGIEISNAEVIEDSVDWDSVCSGPLVGSLLEHVQFELSPLSLSLMDQAHQALSKRMLPLATFMVRSSWYAERRSRCGECLTAHALAAAVTSLMVEFSHLLVQIESQLLQPNEGSPPLMLTQLWYYMQPSLRTFQALDGILYSSPNAVGGALLNSITAFTSYSGDEVLADLATFLLERAFAPLLLWLEEWLVNGVLNDPHQEFFIKENTPLHFHASFKAEDWAQRFSLVKDHVPLLLSPHAEAILSAGKSLFALKLCKSSAGPVKITLVPTSSTATKDHLENNTEKNVSSSSSKRTLSVNPLMAVTKSSSSRRSSVASIDIGGGGGGGGKGSSNSSVNGGSVSTTTHVSSPRPLGLNFLTSNASSIASSGITANAVSSPSKKSTVIGADIQGVIPRELAPEESQSVLDRVFNSRRQSQASLSESLPAAGLPSVSMASVTTVPFDARFVGGTNAFPALELVPSIDPFTKGTTNGLQKVSTRRVGSDNIDENENGEFKSAANDSVDPWGTDDLAMKEAATSAEISVWLSAVKEAVGNSIESSSPLTNKIAFSLDPQSYAQYVLRASNYASSKLLEFLFTRPSDHAPTLRASPFQGVLVERGLGADLLGQLLTMKAFFLMSQGDWVVGFLDLAENDLGATVINPSASLSLKQKLGAFFESAVKASVASDDAHIKTISCCIAPLSLIATIDAERTSSTGGASSSSSSSQSLRGCDVFCLDVDIRGPAALVLSPIAISKYKLLFRHLLLVRHVERAVSVAWLAHQSCKELDGSLSTLLSHSYALRHKMLHFLQNLSYFVSVEVIEPHWHEMAQKLRSATSLDDVISAHTFFLDVCMSESLLSSSELLKLLTKLVTLCLIFSDQISKAIHDHRLPEDELDKRAGVNRAGLRTRTQRERGEYYVDSISEGDDKSNQRSALGGRRSSKQQLLGGTIGGSSSITAASSTSAFGAASVNDRAKRASRLEVQAAAMQSHMAQAGWQAMIEKSARIFDGLLRDLILALATRARDEHDGPVSRLLTRLDFNQYFSTLWGFEA
jgi:hypothetical protein